MSSAIPSSAAPNVVTLRDLLRLDLKDPSGSSAVWTDAALERHIARAVREYSLAYPYEVVTRLVATAGSRDLSIATLTDLVRIDAVEWPVDQYPPSPVDHQVFGSTLSLRVSTAPATGNLNVDVFWGQLHACSSVSLTVPTSHWDLVLTGAGAYAAEEWASYASNRVNLDAKAVTQYLEQARRKLTHFHAELHRPGRSGTVRVRTAYAPWPALPPSQSTDPGP